MFDSSGKLINVDGIGVEREKSKDDKRKKRFEKNNQNSKSYEKIQGDSLPSDLDEKFGGSGKSSITSEESERIRNFENKNVSFEDRNDSSNPNFDSNLSSNNFGLMANEKIERLGWGGKKRPSSNFNNREWEKKDEFSESSLTKVRNNYDERYEKKYPKKFKNKLNSVPGNNDSSNNYHNDSEYNNCELKKVDSLGFLKNDDFSEDYNINEIKNKYWNFYLGDKYLKPLKFSNNKTQEDIVKEVVKLIKGGNKIIFLKGVCGSGKSAIALNIARSLGKAAIVVPLKSLQKQYEDDYTNKKYLLKPDKKRLKIASITGKDNHDSIYMPGISCADKNLPENIKITEKNAIDIMRYYDLNEFNDDKETKDIKDIKRTWIAPANPYWSPILPVEFEITNLKKAKKYKYQGCNGKEFVFYHRKSGCSYYDQFLAYIYADVIIYNSAKYKSELQFLKKPATEVDIIDEADEFLDSLFNQKKINLKRFYDALVEIQTESREATELKSKILRLLELEFKNNDFENQDFNSHDSSNQNLGFDNELKDKDIKEIKKTNLLGIFKKLLENNDLVAEISIEELNYCNQVIDVVKSFTETINDIYLSYKIIKNNFIVSLVTSDLSGCIKEITDKNKAMVFMSGTLHSEEVIKNILGIKDYKIVEAETINQGNIEIIRTGREFNCQYSTFSQNEFTREKYLFSVSACVKKAKFPVLIHVNAFKDLPSDDELTEIGITNLISSNKLIANQRQDKLGSDIKRFKDKETEKLFTTRCSRGMDFPGDTCNSVMFTKYPNPNVNDMFWKILKRSYPNHFWDFYRDKAKREFHQRLYRALRSTDDHIYVLSPDIRVIDAVRELQMEALSR